MTKLYQAEKQVNLPNEEMLTCLLWKLRVLAVYCVE